MNGRPGVIVQVSSAKQFVGQDVQDVTELMKRMKSVGLRVDVAIALDEFFKCVF